MISLFYTHIEEMNTLHPKNQFALFRSRKFLPLFLTQFLGAFNDNFFKSAMVILITYRLAAQAGQDARLLVTAAAGVFILPFFIFSATAGQLADKYERSRLVRIVKIAEIIVMSGAALGFYLGNIILLMSVLFMMGAQSAFFGPLKYSILPQHLQEDELIAGNALIETGTFLAILTGTIFGGLLILIEGGIPAVSILVIGIATLGWWASLYIPSTQVVNPKLKLTPNIVRETLKIVTEVTPYKDIFLSILGIAWFWLVGATFLSQFPTYAKEVIGANEQVATLFLAVFSIGIGLGSLACNSLLKGEVSGRYVPWAALGMSIASTMLYFASLRTLPATSNVIGVMEFFKSPANWAVLFCLLMISLFGGLYIVPLYALIQVRTAEARMARVIACSNIMDSLFMVVSAVGTTALLAAGVAIPGIFLVTAILTLIAAFIIRRAVKKMLRKKGK